MKHEINVFNQDGKLVVVEIREGQALPLKEPRVINISANFDAVSRFIENRNGQLFDKDCHILIDREKGTITLHVNETSAYMGVVKGVLEETDIFKAFEINTGKKRDTFELADFIRMNRSYFESLSVAANLVTTLNNFKVKVDKEVENSDDRRGNKNLVRRQVVESNIPSAFKVNLPIFKGMESQTVEVEVNIDPETFACTLISPHAAEIVQGFLKEVFDEEIRKIKEINGRILIVEQ